MNKIINTNSIFESIKHVDEEGREYWLARELQMALGYKEWRYFVKVVKKSDNNFLDHLGADTKMVDIGSNTKYNVDTYGQFVQLDKLSINVNGGKRIIKDYKLSRYACYLIAQNDKAE